VELAQHRAAWPSCSAVVVFVARNDLPAGRDFVLRRGGHSLAQFRARWSPWFVFTDLGSPPKIRAHHALWIASCRACVAPSRL